MTACPTHSALLGGYVLGSLEPSEMDEMRVHVPGCPHCEPEARALGALPTLLDSIDPADVPPPALSPTIEEAVLERFTRERAPRRQAEPAPPALGCARRASPPSARPARGARDRVRLVGGRTRAPTPTPARSSRRGTVHTASAIAWADDIPAGTRVRLRARGLPATGRRCTSCGASAPTDTG